MGQEQTEARGGTTRASQDEQDADLQSQKFVEACLACALEEIEQDNPGFSKHFGEHTPCTIDPTSRIICVRHATSCANYAQVAATLPKSVARIEEIGGDVREEEQLRKIGEQLVGGSRALVDCPLHPYGIVQTEKRAHLLHDVDFHTVLVSPLRRTLQTCDSLFKTHPQRAKIRFLVFPDVREWVRFTDGIPCDYRRLRYLFRPPGEQSSCLESSAGPEPELQEGGYKSTLDFDWSLVDETIQKYYNENEVVVREAGSTTTAATADHKHWFLSSFANKEKRTRLHSKVASIVSTCALASTSSTSTGTGENRYDPDFDRAPLYANGCVVDKKLAKTPLTDAMLPEMRDIIPHPLEDYFDVMRRARKTVRFLRQYLKTNVPDDHEKQKIGIVAHYRFLDALFAAGKPEDQVKVTALNLRGGKSFSNCEISSWPMDQMEGVGEEEEELP
ncbi:unnamed protein product [Amoebophrya sp. A25]|nr:unnamed protein product [Amoebophrya sp. A25]|eukprot:GSA25T00023817001.1